VADDGSKLALIDLKDLTDFTAKMWREKQRRDDDMQAGPEAVLRAIEVLIEERHWRVAAQLIFLSLVNSSKDKRVAEQATKMLASFDCCQQYLAAYLRERSVGPESN
jgi:hypothetical protein